MDNRKPGDGRDDLDSIAEVLDDLDFGRQTESLAPPLGAPPPLPPPPELEDEDVLSSAPRPVPRTLTSPRAARELTPPPPGNLLDAPTDDEVFGSDFDDELDDVFAAIGAPSSKPKPRPSAVPAPTKGQEFSESTRIHEVEEDLLERSAREEPRRTAAVVRRDQLPAKDPTRKTGPSSVLDIAAPTPFEEHTRIADLIEEREASHAPEPEEEPPPEVALDESFYDDIEIGSASGPEVDDEPLERPTAPPQARRVTQNVVRRAATKAPGAEASQPRIQVAREVSQPRIIVDEAVGGPLLEDLFHEGASGTAPAGSDDDGETIDRDAARRRGIGSPLEEAVAEFAATTGQAERPAEVDDYDSFSQSDAPAADDDLPNEAWADALDHARVDVPPAPDAVDGAVGDDGDDDPVGTFSIAEVETPSARRAAQPRGPRERRPKNPIPETEETFLDLPLELDAIAIADGAAGAADEPADVRRARSLDELEEARRADVPPRDLARILLVAGQASEAAGDRDAASDCYDEALHLDETFAPAIRAHRRLLVATGKYPAAARLLELEVGLAGPDERAPLAAFRGDLLMAIGEEDLARVAFGELVDARPDDIRSLLAQLELAYTDGRDDEVAAILAALGPHLEDRRLHATLAVLRGRLAEKQRRADEAAEAYQTALGADEGNRAAAWGLARLAFAKGQVADAARWFPAMLAGIEDAALTSAAQRQQVVAALATGDSALAIEAAERAASEPDPLALEAMAEAYSWSARRTETLLALQAWADAEPAPARRAEILRRLLLLQATPVDGEDATAEVETTLGELVAADPDDTDAREELAGRRLAAGDLEGAVALSANRADVGASLAAMRLYERNGRVDEAAAALAELVAVVGDSRVLAEARSGLYARAGAAYSGKLASLLAEDANDWRDPSSGAERLAWAAQSWAVAAGPDEAEAADAQAVDAWRGLAAVDPGAEAAHAALVSRARAVAEAGGDRAGLIEALAEIAAVTRDPARLAATSVEEAALRLRDGHDADAIRVPLERVLAAAPGEARAVAVAAAIAAARGEWSDYAARLVERADLLGTSAARTGKEAPEADALRFRAAAALARDPAEAPRALEVLATLLDARPGFAGADLVAEQAARASGDVAVLVSLAERDVDHAEDPLGPARLLRLAELHEQAGDSTRAAARYRALLGRRPHDPLAHAGFERVAVAAGALAVLGDLALESLRRAEEDGDPRAKITAWEALAHVDGELRGDRASGTVAQESILALDPGHAGAQRALERTYLEENREAELGVLYGQVAAALVAADSAADAVPIHHLRARLAERRGEQNEALADLRRVAELAPADRAALFRLESRARESGLADEVARWDDAIAAHFEGDPRAQAAFLTRAGEAWVDSGRRGVDPAIARFRAAVTASPGFFPALRAWLRLALVEERWGDVATVSEQQAEIARTDAERAHLYHLAGVTAMERGDDPERAAADLRHVLALDPRHEDAFRRLRKLLVTHGRHADLAELLGQRVEIETETPRLVELHATLATLYRDALGDPERAKAHLRAVLSRDPRNLHATAALSDITWGLGQWGEAAEALIARARLETEPQLLKETFFRLGVIYSDHLPDRRWALKSFERVLGFDPNDLRALEYVSQLAMAGGEWRLALGATERLSGLDLPGVSVRAGHILRIARIHEEGFADAKRAEDSLKRAHELDPTNADVLAAIVAFYQRRRDLPTLRVHLDRTAGTMRWRLAKSPGDGLAYRTLARALATRGQLGVVGSVEAARAAAELAHAFGAADETDLALIAEATTPTGRGLGELGIDEVLFHPSIPNGFRQIFRLLYETLGKRFPADVRRFGVGRAERLPRTGHPFRELAGTVAAELGIKDLEVYVATAQPLALAVEMTDPISLIVGSALVDATKPAQIRFAVGRALKLYASYMALPARLSPEELGVLLAGIIRLYDPQFAPPGVAAAAIAEEAQRLGRLVPKRLRDEVAPFASEIHGQEFDHQALWLGVQHTGNRAGLVAGGSVLAATSVLLRRSRLGDLAAGLEDPEVVELLRFAVGDEHCDVRRTLSSA